MAWPSEDAFYPQDWAQRVRQQLRAIANRQGVSTRMADAIGIMLDGPTSRGAQMGFRLEALKECPETEGIIAQFTEDMRQAHPKVITETAFRLHPSDFVRTFEKMTVQRRQNATVEQPGKYVNGASAHAMLSTDKGLGL